MKVGMAVVLQNIRGERSDLDVYREERALAELAEPLGFDSLWSTEHHFSEYMIVPDVTQFLTYMAAKTRRISLGTGVQVLPWHDPVKVAEQVAMLDLLSEGRVLFGVGRGSGKLEFEGLRVPMEDSRERFREAAEIVIQGLSGQPFSYEGKYFKVPGITVRPKPAKSFANRIYGAAVSPESAEVVARLGFGLMVIPQRPWDETAKDVKKWAAVRESQGLPKMAPITQCWVYVGEGEEEAKRSAPKFMGEYWESADRHYGLSAGHHEGVKGYEFFDRAGQLARVASREDQVRAYLDFHVWGSAEQCIRKIKFIQDKIGNDHFIGVFRYGGMSKEEGERNVRRFARDVMPVLQSE